MGEALTVRSSLCTWSAQRLDVFVRAEGRVCSTGPGSITRQNDPVLN